MIRIFRTALATSLALATLPVAAPAITVVPVPLHHALAGARSTQYRPRPSGPRTYFGTIFAIDGARLVLRLRNGRKRSIDATQALAANDYSQPLFVGKMVAIDGIITNGVFAAAHIYRVTSLQGLGNDK